MDVEVVVANEGHTKFAKHISGLIADAAQKRGTGIAERSPEYLSQKMKEGKAVIALKDDEPVGFCYMETWGHNKYVANSGLIVVPEMRKTGLAKKIKRKMLELSQQKYPGAKVFGITTSLAVMKINSELGYKPVTFSELTDDEKFWQGCSSCKNYDILQRTERKHCLCTGMMYKPETKIKVPEKEKRSRWENFKRFIRLNQLKQKRKQWAKAIAINQTQNNERKVRFSF